MHNSTKPPVTDWIAVLMLLISLLVSVRLVGPLVHPGEVPAMVAITVVLLGYRGWLLIAQSDQRTRPLGYWPALLCGAPLVYISPVYGAYVFIGYLETPRAFSAPQRAASLVLTALITAAAQMGGPRGSLASWPLYAILVAVNLAVVAVIQLVEQQRLRTMQKLEQTIAELRAAERRADLLRAQLVTQAREAGIQEERARLSREIHDTVAQGLVGIITQLAATQSDDPELAARLDRTLATAREALAEARRAVRARASPRLDSDPLPAALAELVAQTGQRTGLAARFVLTGEPGATGADADLLRIAQESLSNTARHARANRVVVSLDYGDDEVRLDVRDDGRGFRADRLNPGRGLPGMAERLAAHGGSVEIESREGAGCTVSAAIPR